jgi:imidazolonepropionase-like amidohydrolase
MLIFFVRKNYFTANDTEQLIKEAKKYNIPAKIHVNQFNSIGGIKIAVRNKAVSVDHLEVVERTRYSRIEKRFNHASFTTGLFVFFRN